MVGDLTTKKTTERILIWGKTYPELSRYVEAVMHGRCANELEAGPPVSNLAPLYGGLAGCSAAVRVGG